MKIAIGVSQTRFAQIDAELPFQFPIQTEPVVKSALPVIFDRLNNELHACYCNR